MPISYKYRLKKWRIKLVESICHILCLLREKIRYFTDTSPRCNLSEYEIKRVMIPPIKKAGRHSDEKTFAFSLTLLASSVYVLNSTYNYIVSNAIDFSLYITSIYILLITLAIIILLACYIFLKVLAMEPLTNSRDDFYEKATLILNITSVFSFTLIILVGYFLLTSFGYIQSYRRVDFAFLILFGTPLLWHATINKAMIQSILFGALILVFDQIPLFRNLGNEMLIQLIGLGFVVVSLFALYLMLADEKHYVKKHIMSFVFNNEMKMFEIVKYLEYERLNLRFLMSIIFITIGAFTILVAGTAVDNLSFLHGNIEIEMETAYPEGITTIPFSVHATGPITGISVNLSKVNSSNINQIDYIEIDDENNITTLCPSECGLLLGNIASLGNYDFFINSTGMTAGYYEIKCNRLHYDDSVEKVFFIKE
ncbi:hypothetical protein [Methanolobus profundi]|uniref:Uncharacterized protein n=1 Tax=Methanolobus profundi TaxID=487685 RepID=A0A1I4RBR6_9EURY|nr:hypothetical protein [Methanolobus profundi]SFM49744.1 hypothetical protein SAMN04488696_1489 [Methanolobus profundi]